MREFRRGVALIGEFAAYCSWMKLLTSESRVNMYASTWILTKVEAVGNDEE